MIRAVVETFVRRLRAIQEKYEDFLAHLEEDHLRKEGAPRLSGRKIALEAHARLYLLDPLLNELGWEVGGAGRMVVEDGIEAAAGDADAHRRRLDYHGRDNAEGRSLLIVEAKRPGISLPEGTPEVIRSFFAEELAKINTGRTDSSSAFWHELLRSAVDYVRRISSTYNQPPRRFLLSNGDWFVVFVDVEVALLSQSPESASIEVFQNLESVVRRADEFCKLVSYADLSDYIPSQHPSALVDFVAEGSEAVCARVVDVFYGRHGERQPLQSIRVGVWVRIANGRWVHFCKDYNNPFLIISGDTQRLKQNLVDLRERADDLFSDLGKWRKLRFASAEEFDTHRDPSQMNSSAIPKAVLARELSKDIYRIVTVEEILYLVEEASFDNCPYHDWGACRSEGNAVGQGPIAAQSSDPPCYFPSGSQYHCAHAEIYAIRKHKCLLLPFEEYLCCKRCVFLSRCWPDTSQMPCKKAAALET